MPLPIESLTTAALSAALDAAMQRQAAVSANIANANTESYVPVRLDFDARLEEARNHLHERGTLEASHLDAIRATPEAASDDAGRAAGVQLDLEMAELARNAAQFQTLAQALTRHLGLLALAAADGRR